MSRDELIIEGARQNNLKGIDLRLPHNRVIVITGVSGSGKSSLCFDTIFVEGQWRFIESLSTYARLFLEKLDRPDVDSIRNIRPAIALEQHNPYKASRSTVGTSTEVFDYLRLLYAKIGRPYCPLCGRELRQWSASLVIKELLERHYGKKALVIFESSETTAELRKKGYIRFRINGEITEKYQDTVQFYSPIEVVLDRLVIRDGQRLGDSIEIAWRQGNGTVIIDLLEEGSIRFSDRLRCDVCGIDLPKPQPLLFSFNHPIGACPECKGFGNILRYDDELVIPDKDLSLKEGAIEPWNKPAARWWKNQFLKKAKGYGIDINIPYKDLSDEAKRLIHEGSPDFYGIKDFFEDLEERKYKLHVRVFLSRYRKAVPCPVCGGSRLKKDALSYRINGRNIAELSAMSIKGLYDFFSGLDITGHERQLSSEILRQIGLKLDFLLRVELGYLTLDRLSKSLSGGEAQRINLANQLASRLTGTLYVLDEPTVGLHQTDTERIASIVMELSEAGNTIIIVEHDRSMINAADWIVELGPGGGEKGGRLMFSGTTEDFLMQAKTLTARYLRGAEEIPVPAVRRKGDRRWLRLYGCKGNNLKAIDLCIPIQGLTCITGVSGSGKSTLIEDTLYKALARAFKIQFDTPQPYDCIEGIEYLKGVKIIQQSPIGRTPRSNPVTYIKAFDAIRRLFASQAEAKALDYTPGSFSFNVPGGRCEACKGEGFQRLEMYFFEDLYVKCEHCGGKRYKAEALRVTYKGKDIHQIFNMTVTEAIEFFKDTHGLERRLQLMADVGLGYLRLGQSATTLSGGEAQRLKICAELGRRQRRDYLYILDEPTVGLHFDDIKKLLHVLNELVDAGNTVVVVEHNLDVIKCADWVIDLGPEGGDNGGRIVAEGTPETVAGAKESYTGRALREMLISR